MPQARQRHRRALFHPDCDRRPRVHTGSADRIARTAMRARGLVQKYSAITAGGEFHPALRTLRLACTSRALIIDSGVRTACRAGVNVC